jgi:membrane protein DedA with SNARE-associated domain
LKKLYRRYFEASLSERLANNNSLPLRLFRRMNHLSSFSVALGRLLGLRIPLTLTLGAKRQFTLLLFGVMLSSLAWDGIYISLGIAGGQAVLEPAEMLLYSLVGLTLLYVITFGVRYLKRRLSRGSVNYISGVR